MAFRKVHVHLSAFAFCLLTTGCTSTQISKPDSLEARDPYTSILCTNTAELSYGTVAFTHSPEGKPLLIDWLYTLETTEGRADIRSHWSRGYGGKLRETAQFMINIIPNQPGPKFARVEFHPESFSYNHWGMRFGAATARNEDNSYFVTGIWHSAESIEASGERIFLRVQRITNDTINANFEGNAIFSAELPKGLFAISGAEIEAQELAVQAMLKTDRSSCHIVEQDIIVT